MAEQEEIGTEECGRCKQAHPDLVFTPFKEPAKPITALDRMTWTHWAICPTTGEPVTRGRIATTDEEWDDLWGALWRAAWDLDYPSDPNSNIDDRLRVVSDAVAALAETGEDDD